MAPNDMRAHLGLGRHAQKCGDAKAALAHFTAAAKAEPGSPAIQLAIATLQRDTGEFDAARQTASEILRRHPGNIDALLSLGRIERSAGRHENALTHFQSAISIAPSDPMPLLEAATALRDLGRSDESYAAFLQVLTIAPGNVRAHLGLGRHAKKCGDPETALAHFTAAARAEPGAPAAPLEIATLQRESGDFDAARQTALGILRDHPDNIDAMISIGRTERSAGRHEEALAHFTAAAKAEPGAAAPWLEIATSQRESGDFDEARQTAWGILHRHPNNTDALLSIGRTERLSGRHDEALAAFTQAQTSSPENAGILAEMAIEERWLGHQSNCDALLAQALELNPKHVTAICYLADQATMKDEPERAFELYQRAAQEQPKELRFRLGAVGALLALGEIDQALAKLVSLATEFGPVPAILEKQISLLRQTGYNHAALRLAVEATAAHPYNAQLWVQRLDTELLVGSRTDIAACLTQMPNRTAIERATIEHYAGKFAESHWQLTEAAAHYNTAASIQPNDPWIYTDLIRVNILTFDLGNAKQHLRRFCALKTHETKLKRKSPNISQTHYGQMIDDFCLDHDLLESLADLQLLPQANRIRALRAVVRENPESTAAAISLIITLRQSGALSAASSPLTVPETSSRDSQIPKTIVQFWDSEHVPEDVLALMRTWQHTNPDFKFRLFNDKTAREYLAKRYPPSVRRAYSRCREPAQKADIFRLAYLAAEGGIYADADDRCIAPVGTIIPDHADLVLYQEDLGTVGNDFIATRSRHPVLQSALRLAVIAILRGDSDILWLATGPGLLTRALAPWLANELTDDTQLPPGIAVLDRRELFRAIAIHCTAGYKRTNRHWTNTAFARRHREGSVSLVAV